MEPATTPLTLRTERPTTRRRSQAAGRPWLLAIAVMNAITGIAALVILIPLTAGSDTEIFRRGAQGILDGFIAKDFLYAPLFGVLAAPLTWVTLPVAAWAVSLTWLAVLLAGIALETRGLPRVDRVLITIAVLGFIPVVYELLIGQVTILMAAAVYPVRARDGFGRGLALGLFIGLVPKPMLVPLLLWMLLYRRRALLAALAVAAAVTAAGVALLGTDIYHAWLDAMVGTGEVTRHGNMALTAISPPALELTLMAIASAAALWAIVRNERAGFVAALVVAMLVQPFTLAYAISILLLAVRPAMAMAPRATRVLALTANIAVIGPFMLWAAAALAACVMATRPSRRRWLSPAAPPAAGPGAGGPAGAGPSG
jgi:hypothetical protein